MFGSASGPLGALLIIAPLAAIPIFAVVGIPQFAPVSASPSDDEEINDLSHPEPGRPEAVRATPHRSAGDLYAPVQTPPPMEPPQQPAALEQGRPGGAEETLSADQSRDSAGSDLPPEALNDWEVSPNLRSRMSREPSRAPARRAENLEEPTARPGQTREFSVGLIDAGARRPPQDAPRAAVTRPQSVVQGRTSPDPVRPGTAASRSRNRSVDLDDNPEQSGWKSVAQRLKAHGIQKYRLESQLEAQQFLFRCEYPATVESNVTELFEAAADTPLEAVMQALRQIDEWLQQDDRTLHLPAE